MSEVNKNERTDKEIAFSYFLDENYYHDPETGEPIPDFDENAFNDLKTEFKKKGLKLTINISPLYFRAFVLKKNPSITIDQVIRSLYKNGFIGTGTYKFKGEDEEKFIKQYSTEINRHFLPFGTQNSERKLKTRHIDEELGPFWLKSVEEFIALHLLLDNNLIEEDKNRTYETLLNLFPPEKGIKEFRKQNLKEIARQILKLSISEPQIDNLASLFPEDINYYIDRETRL